MSGGPDRKTQHRLIVAPDEPRRRLDRLLAERIPGQSRAHLQRLIKEGQVEVDGVICLRAGRIMTGGERILVNIPPNRPSDLTPEAIPLDILYEDDHLIAVNKPAGLIVHPGAGRREGTLVHALMHHCTDLSGIGGIDRPGIVHRLDKDTSGVLVVAKDDRTHRHLSRQFQDRTVEKIYLALVLGRVTDSTGTIDVPIGRDTRTRVTISRHTRRPRKALTRYRVLQRFEEYTWLEVAPRTGRTHQIRVHLKLIGHPIVGDAVYGLRRRGRSHRERIVPRLALHARSIVFDHPDSGERMTIEAPIPDDLSTALETLAS